MKIPKILLSFLVFYPLTVFAEWTYISMNASDGTKVYLNFETIQRNKNFVKIWSKYELNPFVDGPSNQRMLSASVYKEYDCAEKKQRQLAINTYTENNLRGKVIESSSATMPWNFIAPDTVNSSLLNAVCKK